MLKRAVLPVTEDRAGPSLREICADPELLLERQALCPGKPRAASDAASTAALIVTERDRQQRRETGLCKRGNSSEAAVLRQVIIALTGPGQALSG